MLVVFIILYFKIDKILLLLFKLIIFCGFVGILIFFLILVILMVLFFFFIVELFVFVYLINSIDIK